MMKESAEILMFDVFVFASCNLGLTFDKYLWCYVGGPLFTVVSLMVVKCLFSSCSFCQARSGS